jgi:hypothetical protein
MMETANKSLNVTFTETELRQISDCADVQRLPPDAWVRRVVSDIARRVIRARTAEND